MTLTVGSLFSGIGGLDLGLERAGMQVIWQSEIDPFANKILKKHWPEVPNHGDIKNINWETVERPNVICGGYPCQPFSTAGKRRGEEDPRHLWPWVRNAISRLRPDYAILENVRGHLSMGGLSVIGDLASIGYDAEWRVVSAASVGANHRRDRIIIVAYPNNTRGGASECGVVCGENTHEAQGDKQPESGTFNGACGCGSNVANTASKRLQGVVRPVYERNGNGFTYSGWEWWQTEPDVGRVANGVSNRVDRLRGLGNAVVPQVAEVIGRLVVAHAKTI